MYRDDYERAGYHMLPQFDRDSRFTRGEIVAFTLALIVDHAGSGDWTHRFQPMGFTMLLAGGFLLYHSLKLATSGSRVLASRLLHASVIYLPVVLAIMALGP